MHLIRNRVLATVMGMALLAGCQGLVQQSAPSSLNETPLIVDEAMQQRDDWDRSTVYYANGATVAGGTDYVWQTHETVPPEYRRLSDAPVAVLNFASMPVGAFTNSSAKKQIYRGESVPPSFHGNPAVPGEAPARRTAPMEISEPAVVTPPAEPAPAPPAERLEAPAVEPLPPVVEPVPPVEPTVPDAPVTPEAAPRSAPEPPLVEPAPPVVEPVTPVEPTPPLAPPTPQPAPPRSAPEPPGDTEAPLVPPPAPPATEPQ